MGMSTGDLFILLIIYTFFPFHSTIFNNTLTWFCNQSYFSHIRMPPSRVKVSAFIGMLQADSYFPSAYQPQHYLWYLMPSSIQTDNLLVFYRSTFQQISALSHLIQLLVSENSYFPKILHFILLWSNLGYLFCQL